MGKKPRMGRDPLSFIQDSRQAAAKPEEKSQTKTKSNTQTFSQTYQQTSADNIKDKASQDTVTQRLEDNRRRQTYWMDPEEIKMISEIAEMAGVRKYQVVSAAVRMLYEYVLDEKEES